MREPAIAKGRAPGLNTGSSGVAFALVLILAIPLMLGLRFFVAHTRLGKAMRATAQDRDASALMGIDINVTIAVTFLIGGALAGSAGFIYGLYNNSAWFLQGRWYLQHIVPLGQSYS